MRTFEMVEARVSKSFPQVSFVLSTRDRCDVLLHTLAQINACGLAAGTFDIHVVDNASTDGTQRRVREAFPDVRLIPLRQNRGAVAKNLALEGALGQYVVFLDDDSYPEPGSVGRMIEHFDADAKLGAATFTITLPDGRRECSAYQDVFIGCGVGFRRRVLRMLGGLPDDFFMQAEEYDLSLRLLDAGWRVRTFDDLHVTHLKTPRARANARTMRMDVRNNLHLTLRHFPRRHVLPYAMDWMRRYAWIAKASGRRTAFAHGVIEGILRSAVRPKRVVINEAAFEQFSRLAQTTELLLASLKALPTDIGASESRGTGSPSPGTYLSAAPKHGLKKRARPTSCARVVLIDVGKNVYAYWRACRTLGVEIVAIADEKLAAPGRKYRGIPVVTDATAAKLAYDAAVVANTSPVHASTRRVQWRSAQEKPVIDLFESAGLSISDARRAASESRRIVARSA
ncbi:MAG TPA: glycosyltransferase [Tepidisphaeraceae bacterium]|jgi:GT2 family glycosyltransferase